MARVVCRTLSWLDGRRRIRPDCAEPRSTVARVAGGHRPLTWSKRAGVTRAGRGYQDHGAIPSAVCIGLTRKMEDPMVNKKKNRNVDSEREEIEADRQKDTSQWARAFGVSSDDLRGATAPEDPLEHDELDPKKKGSK